MCREAVQYGPFPEPDVATKKTSCFFLFSDVHMYVFYQDAVLKLLLPVVVCNVRIKYLILF